MARRQRMTQAGMMAAHAVRDGDRAGSSSGPDLKNKS
jgi:type IV secretory pathway TrbL component